VGLTLLFLLSAVYDFVTEGWGSLSGVQYLLIVASIIALAPFKDKSSEEGRAERFRRLLHSPRYVVGVAGCVAAVCLLMFRVARGFHLW
jgi:hypothetical protein